METFTLNGKTYEISRLPEDAQKLARQAMLTRDHIEKLEARVAIAKTAQSRYLSSLKTVIDRHETGETE